MNIRHPCFHVVITKVTRIKGTHHASRSGKGRANDARAVTDRSTAICHHLQLVQQLCSLECLSSVRRMATDKTKSERQKRRGDQSSDWSDLDRENDSRSTARAVRIVDEQKLLIIQLRLPQPPKSCRLRLRASTVWLAKPARTGERGTVDLKFRRRRMRRD